MIGPGRRNTLIDKPQLLVNTKSAQLSVAGSAVDAGMAGQASARWSGLKNWSSTSPNG